jgi:hypothetical protein
MDGVTFDTSQLDALAVELGSAGRKATLGAAKIIAKGAGNIEKGMRLDFSGHRYAPRIPQAINSTIRGLSAEIGVDKRGPQGGLGNILAFGTSRNGPVVDHTAGLRREIPAVEEWMSKLGIESL